MDATEIKPYSIEKVRKTNSKGKMEARQIYVYIQRL